MCNKREIDRIDTSYANDVLNQLYAAVELLPACTLAAIMANAIQEIQALRANTILSEPTTWSKMSYASHNTKSPSE
jgi:hypothetical protein